MGASLFGSASNFCKSIFNAGATGASALKYGTEGLETQAFGFKLSMQSEALAKPEMFNMLVTYQVSDQDSENIKNLCMTARLMQQAQAQVQQGQQGQNQNAFNLQRR